MDPNKRRDVVGHGHLDALAAAGVLALVQGGDDAHGGHQAGAVVGQVRAGFGGWSVRVAGETGRAAESLRGGFEAREVGVRRIGGVAFDLGIDDFSG